MKYLEKTINNHIKFGNIPNLKNKKELYILINELDFFETEEIKYKKIDLFNKLFKNKNYNIRLSGEVMFIIVGYDFRIDIDILTKKVIRILK